jgi:hypothetical protein
MLTLPQAGRSPLGFVLVLGVVVLCLFMAGISAGGIWLASAHASVSAKVERIEDRTRHVDEDHDKLSRIESQLEYVGKLMLISINDSRAKSEDPLIPDEFPRGD